MKLSNAHEIEALGIVLHCPGNSWSLMWKRIELMRQNIQIILELILTCVNSY